MAKPVVDRIEKALNGTAPVIRLSVMSQIGMEIAKKYGIRGIPTLMAFNGNGRMIFSRTGAFRVEETVQEVSNIRGYD